MNPSKFYVMVNHIPDHKKIDKNKHVWNGSGDFKPNNSKENTGL